MEKLAIACEKSINSETIIEALRRSKYDIYEYQKIVNLIKDLEHSRLNGLVLGVQKINAEKIPLLNSVRKITQSKPLVFVCKQISEPLRSGSFGVDQDIFFLNQQEVVHLPGVLNKMFLKKPIKMRQFIRYPVHLQAMAYGQDHCQSVHIENISKGGVLIRNSGRHLSADESLWIEFPSQKSQEPHLREVQVHWRTVSSKSSGGGPVQWAGCQFKQAG